MSQLHSERDIELEHYRQLVGNLKDRWQAVFAQIELRQQELDLLSRQMQAYRQSYDWLIRWIADAKQRQDKLHAVPIDSKALQEQLTQEKVSICLSIYLLVNLKCRIFINFLFSMLLYNEFHIIFCYKIMQFIFFIYVMSILCTETA